MPFIIRDISWWMNEDLNTDETIQRFKTLGGEDIVNIYHLDTFKKDNKISHTIRIIYQNQNKTLTDGIVNDRVAPIYQMLLDNNYEIR